MKTERFEYLDSVRGIACMVVVLIHAVSSYSPYFWKFNSNDATYFLKYPPFSFLISGVACVCLFFILSGFVLSYRFIGSNNNKWSIVESIIKRPFRLGGLVIVSIFIAFGYDFWTNRIFSDYDIFFMRIKDIFSMIPFGIPPAENPPLWTIGIEFIGSILIFAMCFCFGNLDKKYRLITMIVLFFMLIHTFYCAFLVGIICADLHKNWNWKRFIKYKNILSWFIFPIAFICFSYPLVIPQDVTYWKNINYIEQGYVMIGAILMFIFVLCNDSIKKILIIKPLIFIGGISYSIYIIHYLILVNYMAFIMNFTSKYTSNQYLAFTISMLINMAITIIVSYFIDIFIDKPCTNFSGRFAKNLMGEIKNACKIKHSQALSIEIINIRQSPPLSFWQRLFLK